MNMDCNKEAPVYAGFWVRLAAFTIDHVIIMIPLLIASLIVSGMLSIFDGTFLGGNVLFQYTLADIILYFLQVMYFIVCTYITGTTLGKRLMNLRVISTNEDEKFTLMDIIFRETIGRFLCSISMSIGYLLIGLDSQKRGFHDMLSDTRVVYAKKVKVYPTYQGGNEPAPAFGETKSQITEENYFYVSGGSGEEELIEAEADEQSQSSMENEEIDL